MSFFKSDFSCKEHDMSLWNNVELKYEETQGNWKIGNTQLFAAPGHNRSQGKKQKENP